MRATIFLVLVPFLANGQSQTNLYNETLSEKLFLSRPGEVQLGSDASIGKTCLQGLVGSVTVGLFGALLATQLDTECGGSSDVLVVCSGTDKYTHVGAAVGGTVGCSLSLLHSTRKSKMKHKNLRIVLGAGIGGVAGFIISKRTYGISSILLPPLTATIALSL
jgi:hypothetical protein